MQERQTKQKQVIYEALQALDHPTATEVYGYVHELYPTVSRATVFRVLSGFATTGKALGLRAAGDEVRYDYNVEPHYHAHCKICGKVADVKAEGLPKTALFAENYAGFEVEGYSIEFYGTCAACKELWKEADFSETEEKA